MDAIHKLKEFPRSEDRGPIEGRSRRFTTAKVCAFPRSEDRGPIEGWPIGAASLLRKMISAVERSRPH